jgi:hypothetical protein
MPDQPGNPWVFNGPEQGRPFAPYEDIFSVHIYNDYSSAHYRMPLGRSKGTAQIAASVLSYLRRVASYTGSRPILVSEFGAPNGALPSDVTYPVSAQLQDSVIKGVTAGIVQARQQGINVLGGLVWILAPRGGNRFFGGPGNAFSLIIPHGYGSSAQPFEAMPAFWNLCSDMRGIVPCHFSKRQR